MHWTYYIFSQLHSNEVTIPQTELKSDDLQNALRFIFGFAGAMAVVAVTYGGFKYVMSRGNADATNKARDTIVFALIGLIIAITSFGIISFVMDNV